MSTRTNTYAIIGALLPYHSDERLEPYMDEPRGGIHHHEGLCVLRDGMGGEYTVVGQVVAKSDEYGRLDSPVAFPVLDPTDRAVLRQKIEALFPGEVIELRDIVLTHVR